MEAAIAALAGSRRIDIYGQGGGSAALIEDSRLRFFRLGLPVCAYTDGHQQRMSAATLQTGDAVLAISNSGRSKPVRHAVAAPEHAVEGRHVIEAAQRGDLGDRARESLRRVRYTLARIGIAIPSPVTDPTPLMPAQDVEE